MSWRQSGCQMTGEVVPLSPSSRITERKTKAKMERLRAGRLESGRQKRGCNEQSGVEKSDLHRRPHIMWDLNL